MISELFDGKRSPKRAEVIQKWVQQAKFRDLETTSVAKSEPKPPKSGQEAAKEPPGGRQEGQVGGQEGPRGAPGGLPRHARELSETILVL